MLDTNRLCLPRRFSPPQRQTRPFSAAGGAAEAESRFTSAEDFDATGILTGMDLCASSYWWMPELHATMEAAGPATLPTAHAAARASSRTTAAA